MSTPGLAQLATLLRARGLVAEDGIGSALRVTNPISATRVEVVRVAALDCYRTGVDYEIGQVGQEPDAAERLAFLLGVPVNAVTNSGSVSLATR
jgi:hypothetical protein